MTSDEILDLRSHRPIPMPEKPWIMRQDWHDLLFAHWAVDPERLRPYLPPQLKLDLWDGRAYIGVTTFEVRNLRPRGAPGVPGMSRFPEANMRTYVTLDDIPGVFFFSLDAANLSAVVGARFFYSLPYFPADMNITHWDGHILYSSRRRPSPTSVELMASYASTSGILGWQPPSESLERFLTERYCLYSVLGTRIYRAQIHHGPWPLQKAAASFYRNTLLSQLNLPDEKPPELCHFARSLEVLVWWPERLI